MVRTTALLGRSMRGILLIAGAALGGLAAVPAQAQTNACAGTYIFCDDFNGPSIDTAQWIRGGADIASQHKVRPGNLVLTTVNDNGTDITVVDARMYGDKHWGAPRQGGVLVSKQRYGGGRYEARIRNLPGPSGCSCFWNYYDSSREQGHSRTRVYTEIDIEMPAHVATSTPGSIWRHTIGLTTGSNSDADADATYIQHVSTIDPFDGQFHIYRWDWYDGINGFRKIDWYVDGILQASTTQHVSDAPARIWVGTWPAPWPGMVYNFDVQHMYIDWVRIAAL